MKLLIRCVPVLCFAVGCDVIEYRGESARLQLIVPETVEGGTTLVAYVQSVDSSGEGVDDAAVQWHVSSADDVMLVGDATVRTGRLDVNGIRTHGSASVQLVVSSPSEPRSFMLTASAGGNKAVSTTRSITIVPKQKELVVVPMEKCLWLVPGGSLAAYAQVVDAEGSPIQKANVRWVVSAVGGPIQLATSEGGEGAFMVSDVSKRLKIAGVEVSGISGLHVNAAEASIVGDKVVLLAEVPESQAPPATIDVRIAAAGAADPCAE
jgi:hypothetical protein